MRERCADVVAVSPIINGAALKGPADRLLNELGHDVSCVGVAKYYQGLVGTFIIDEQDAKHENEISDLGMNVIVTTTIMANPEHAKQLADAVLS